jgi:hypothetical protein
VLPPLYSVNYGNSRVPGYGVHCTPLTVPYRTPEGIQTPSGTLKSTDMSQHPLSTRYMSVYRTIWCQLRYTDRVGVRHSVRWQGAVG